MKVHYTGMQIVHWGPFGGLFDCRKIQVDIIGDAYIHQSLGRVLQPLKMHSQKQRVSRWTHILWRPPFGLPKPPFLGTLKCGLAS